MLPRKGSFTQAFSLGENVSVFARRTRVSSKKYLVRDKFSDRKIPNFVATLDDLKEKTLSGLRLAKKTPASTNVDSTTLVSPQKLFNYLN